MMCVVADCNHSHHAITDVPAPQAPSKAHPPNGAKENRPQARKAKASRNATSPTIRPHSLRRNLVVAAPAITNMRPQAASGDRKGRTPTSGGTHQPDHTNDLDRAYRLDMTGTEIIDPVLAAPQ